MNEQSEQASELATAEATQSQPTNSKTSKNVFEKRKKNKEKEKIKDMKR